MKKYYVLKKELKANISSTLELQFTEEMENCAKSEIIFWLQNTKYDSINNHLIIEAINVFNRYVFSVDLKWIEPAPLHAIIAARLRGEI